MYNYVFVRKDIPLADQLVQVGHACLAAGSRFGPTGELVPSMVLLEVDDSSHLQEVKNHLEGMGIEFVTFFEPDDEMGETSICTQYVRENQRKLFKKYQLWKHKLSS